MTNFPKRIADDLLEFKPSAMGAVRFPNAEGVSVHHSRFRRGTTLVELMIAMLILAIVCVAWLEIIGVQSARREARRREAVERLAGMMDAFMYCYKGTSPAVGTYCLKESFNPAHPTISLNQDVFDSHDVISPSSTISYPFYDSLKDPDVTNSNSDLLDLNPIGYRLVVSDLNSPPNDMNDPNGRQALFGDQLPSSTDVWKSQKWLIGLLYDGQGNMNDVGNPFFRLSICLGVE